MTLLCFSPSGELNFTSPRIQFSPHTSYLGKFQRFQNPCVREIALYLLTARQAEMGWGSTDMLPQQQQPLHNWTSRNFQLHCLRSALLYESRIICSLERFVNVSAAERRDENLFTVCGEAQSNQAKGRFGFLTGGFSLFVETSHTQPMSFCLKAASELWAWLPSVVVLHLKQLIDGRGLIVRDHVNYHDSESFSSCRCFIQMFLSHCHPSSFFLCLNGWALVSRVIRADRCPESLHFIYLSNIILTPYSFW